jgi:CheY-like chemotaxis protein
MNLQLDKTRPVFLLVDDNSNDQALARLAFSQAGVDVDLRIVGDGEAALEYLRREGAYTDPEVSPLPSVMLLDLRMRAVDGYEVLEEVRSDAQLCDLPIVVFTTSNAPNDIARCYRLGCNSYVVKPTQLVPLVAAVRDLFHYWCRLVRVPNNGTAEPCRPQPS